MYFEGFVANSEQVIPKKFPTLVIAESYIKTEISPYSYLLVIGWTTQQWRNGEKKILFGAKILPIHLLDKRFYRLPYPSRTSNRKKLLITFYHILEPRDKADLDAKCSPVRVKTVQVQSCTALFNRHTRIIMHLFYLKQKW